MSDSTLRQHAVPGFRFVVTVDGEDQAAFTECILPSIEWEVEEIKEGGQNTFIHQLPGRRKSAKVSLKNGLGKSKLLDWYMEAINNENAVKRKRLSVTMYNLQHQPMIVWNIQNAYPVKWSGPQLKSDDNTIAIQTLELACGIIEMERPSEKQ